jgi:peptidoglycan/LPS O-acetylase OafA/YrhL
MGTVFWPAGVPGRVLEWRPLARLGRMSYSLYLWQQLFFDPHNLIRSTGLAWIQDWPWNMLGLAATATVSHLFVERPLTRLGRQLAGALRTRKQTAPMVARRAA